jgi:hypothetical protein
LLEVAEMLAAWLPTGNRGGWTAWRLAHVFEQATLYDEHTWGAFSSVVAPRSLFTKAQWNRKADFAYTASMESHDVLARTARAFADQHAQAGREGLFNLGNIAPEEAYPPSGSNELLVINTLPWARSVLIEEPERRGGAAPAGMLEMFFPRDVPWNGNRPPTPLRRVQGDVPGCGYAFLPLGQTPSGDDPAVAPHVIENAHYRVRLDPATGAVAEWRDKDLGHDFAGTYRGWGIGQYVYEWLDAAAGRKALFDDDDSQRRLWRLGRGSALPPRQRAGGRGAGACRRVRPGLACRPYSRSRHPPSHVHLHPGEPIKRADGRLAPGQGTRHRPRSRLHRLPLQSGAAHLPRRSERRGVHGGT